MSRRHFSRYCTVLALVYSAALGCGTDAALRSDTGSELSFLSDTPRTALSAASERNDTLSTPRSSARTFYVAPSGNDSWSGRLSLPNAAGSDGPFRTVDRAITAATQAGDHVLIRTGVYGPNASQQNNIPSLTVTASGVADRPIVFAAYGDGPVVLDGEKRKSGVLLIVGSHVSVEALEFTQSMTYGVLVQNAANVTIRRCRAYENSYGRGVEGIWGYSPGIAIEGGSHNTVEYSESFLNGNGISLSGSAAEDPATGCSFCTVQFNMVYENTNTSNAGNSDGITGRWAKHAVIRNNVVWRNPDDGFDGLGFTSSRWINNVSFGNGRCVPALSPDVACGNGNGWKTGVRGGGGAHVIGNISFDNETRGFDDGDAVGSVYVDNIAVNNRSWGYLMEGHAVTSMFNIGLLNEDQTGGAGDDFTGTSEYLYSNFNRMSSQSDLARLRAAGQDHESALFTSVPNWYKPVPTITEDPFLAPEDFFGDVNNDGRVTIDEALNVFAFAQALEHHAAAQVRIAEQLELVTRQVESLLAELRALHDRIPQQDQMMNVYQRFLNDLNEAGSGGYTNL